MCVRSTGWNNVVVKKESSSSRAKVIYTFIDTKLPHKRRERAKEREKNQVLGYFIFFLLCSKKVFFFTLLLCSSSTASWMDSLMIMVVATVLRQVGTKKNIEEESTSSGTYTPYIFQGKATEDKYNQEEQQRAAQK